MLGMCRKSGNLVYISFLVKYFLQVIWRNRCVVEGAMFPNDTASL